MGICISRDDHPDDMATPDDDAWNVYLKAILEGAGKTPGGFQSLYSMLERRSATPKFEQLCSAVFAIAQEHAGEVDATMACKDEKTIEEISKKVDEVRESFNADKIGIWFCAHKGKETHAKLPWFVFSDLTKLPDWVPPGVQADDDCSIM
mmetsp:Transcript_106578/g.168375  ORF Transcript_106578/g.168375 Transcript_106578/m.168375 type:complete len:150 (-) Transcript_106578:128-577(-)